MLQIVDIKTIYGDEGDLDVNMVGSGGTGTALVRRGKFAADLIRFQPGTCIDEHTHEGDQIFLCLTGTGNLKFGGWLGGKLFPLYPGVIYMVPGSSVYAIIADEDGSPLTLMSITNNYRSLESEERSEFVDR